MRPVIVATKRLTFVIICILSWVKTIAAEQPQIYKILDYTIKLHKSDKTKDIPAPDRIQINKGLQIVDRFEDHFLEVVSLGYLKFKGDEHHRPYLLVGGYSGGAHCCNSLHAYELAPHFKKAFSYEGDGRVELRAYIPKSEYFIEVMDQSFLYWHSSYAESAMVPIHFKRGLKGLIACEECRRENIDEKESLSLARTLYGNAQLWSTETFGEDPFYPGRVVQEVVILLCNNQPDLAERFLEAAWNPKNPHKEQFKKDLVALLKNNPYWQQLEKKGYKLF